VYEITRSFFLDDNWLFVCFQTMLLHVPQTTRRLSHGHQWSGPAQLSQHCLKRKMAADPGASSGSTPTDQPAQREGTGSQNQAGGGANQGQHCRQGTRHGQQQQQQQDQAPAKGPKV
jgi:hypothetical protein